MLHFPEGMRKSLFPKVTTWFQKIMNSPEAIKAYGRTLLCKNPIKAFNGEIARKPLIIPAAKENKEHKEEHGNNEETEEEKKARRKAMKDAKKKGKRRC